VKLLLDTHAFLWWVSDNPKLSPRARRLIAAGTNQVFFSAASAWEIAINTGLGRLTVAGDLQEFMLEQLRLNGFEVLPIHLKHALLTHRLPPHHSDPFDRMLVAQAMAEGLAILSADPALGRYRVRVVW
jgi:PIN domain nuclease of toxin-antitoxin system